MSNTSECNEIKVNSTISADSPKTKLMMGMPIITLLLNTQDSASAAERVEKPRISMVAMNSTPTAAKYNAAGRKSSSCSRTEPMVRNSKAGVSTRNTRLLRSLIDDSRTQPMRAMNQPSAMHSKTGINEASME